MNLCSKRMPEPQGVVGGWRGRGRPRPPEGHGFKLQGQECWEFTGPEARFSPNCEWVGGCGSSSSCCGGCGDPQLVTPSFICSSDACSVLHAGDFSVTCSLQLWPLFSAVPHLELSLCSLPLWVPGPTGHLLDTSEVTLCAPVSLSPILPPVPAHGSCSLHRP